tara:strand:+ start:113 stop:379 length:267 start_codon:yes stop_codon:yes gene_type:complete
MKTYYLTMINNYKFIVHQETAKLQVTQAEEGSISDLVAIFKARDNFKYWENLENFKTKVNSVVYINPSFKQGAYAEKVNNFLWESEAI